MSSPLQVSRLTSVCIENAERLAAPASFERWLTCDKALVHRKTIRCIAAEGEIPGHFRVARWFL